jgi:predicted signal transduction protein with EAL and GGDEF domain
MQTVAEGVETLAQMQCLEAEGCTEIQGFYVSKPVPASHIPAMLTCDSVSNRTYTFGRLDAGDPVSPSGRAECGVE